MKKNQKRLDNFTALACKEPNLLELHKDALSCAENVKASQRVAEFYKTFKPRICNLIGFDCQRLHEDPSLYTMEAYDTVYDHIINILCTANYRRYVIKEIYL
jgi:hypothetical protein